MNCYFRKIFVDTHTYSKYSFGGSAVKNPSANAGDVVQSLDQEDPLEKEKATDSSTLSWEIHGPRSLVGYSSWSHKKVGYN